mmetsp:Transcript_106126/g.167521  ORF Transcript_106126/g.167521 Transcript_106126/m.167521 type:complete len:176 (+) Transcript_106126:90-617(+)
MCSRFLVLACFAHLPHADADVMEDAVVKKDSTQNPKLRALSSLLYYSMLPSQRLYGMGGYRSGYGDYGPRYRGGIAYTNRYGGGYNSDYYERPWASGVGDRGYYSDQYYGRPYGMGGYYGSGYYGGGYGGYGMGGYGMGGYGYGMGGYGRRYYGGGYGMGGYGMGGYGMGGFGYY